MDESGKIEEVVKPSEDISTPYEISPEDEGFYQTLLSDKLEKLLAIERRKKLWLQQHRLYFYVPHGAQASFHSSKAHARLACGSNRSGKTTAGIVEDIAITLGFRPWLLPENLKNLPIEQLLEMYKKGTLPKECLTEIKTPVKVVIIEDDWDVADEILIAGTIDKAGKLTHYIPKGAIAKIEKNGLGYVCQINFINGSSIRIDTEKSFTNNPGSFEGGSCDLVHYDEPKRRELRTALKRGLSDRNGYEIFTLTPLAEAWMKSELWDKAASDPNIATFFFDTKDNPHIDPDGWKAFVDSLTEEEKEARVFGRWTHLRGLVYPEFSPMPSKKGGSICEPLSEQWVAENGTIIGAIDPHPRQPLTCVLLVADREGRLIVWKEVFRKVLIDQFCEMIKECLIYKDSKGANKTLPVLRYICDPFAWIENPVDGRTWADEFISQGIYVEQASKARAQGILEVRKGLKDRKIVVCSNCIETIREFQNYVYQEWKYGSRSEKETPVDKDDHMLECLYRLVLTHPRFVDLAVESEPIEAIDLCPL